MTYIHCISQIIADMSKVELEVIHSEEIQVGFGCVYAWMAAFVCTVYTSLFIQTRSSPCQIKHIKLICPRIRKGSNETRLKMSRKADLVEEEEKRSKCFLTTSFTMTLANT